MASDVINNNIQSENKVDGGADEMLDGLKKAGFADDGSNAGKVVDLAISWKDLQVIGPPIGYYPNAPKTWLLVKEEFRELAEHHFPDINITTLGRRFLGSFLGTEDGLKAYVQEQMTDWIQDIEELANIAQFEPQLAYAAYIFGTSKRWQFLCRTTPGISKMLEPLESIIEGTLIPALVGKRKCSGELRQVFALPTR